MDGKPRYMQPTSHKEEEGLYMVSRGRRESAGLWGKVRNQSIYNVKYRFQGTFCCPKVVLSS